MFNMIKYSNHLEKLENIDDNDEIKSILLKEFI